MITPLQNRYAYLFDNIEEEIAQLCTVDNAHAQFRAKRDNYLEQAQEHRDKAEAARKEVQAIELKIAELEGLLKQAHAERGMALGLVKTHIYQSQSKEQHAKFADGQVRKREKQLFMKETQRRVHRMRKEFS